MARQPARDGLPRQQGFSRFEFAVAAALFATLVGVAAHRLNMYQQQLESVAAEQLVATLRVALQSRVIRLTAAQRRDEFLTIVDENPIDWLSDRPKNYLGEYYSPDNEKLTKGSWYFDRSDKTLVHLLADKKSFGNGPLILLKFKVILQHWPLKPAKPDLAGTIENVALIQVIDGRTVGDQ